jgi:murein DD-endopeptidase MepM/ murein hydrolase activator NlpD
LTWLRPLTDPFEAAIEALSALPGPAEVAAAVGDGLEAGLDLVASISTEGLRESVEELLDIVESDLGVTADFLHDQIEAFFEGVAARLEDVPGDASAEARADRLEAAALVRRLRRRVGADIPVPMLDADAIVDALLELLARLGIGPLVGRAACVASGLAGGVATGRSLLQLVPFTGFGSGSVGAAAAAAGNEDRYCWYASWLLGMCDRPRGVAWLRGPGRDRDRWFHYVFGLFLPGDEIWIAADAKKIFRRNALRPNEDLLTGTDLDWPQLTIFDPTEERHYTFATYTPETLEKWAYGTAVAVNALEIVLHLISLEEGDLASNLVNAGLNGLFVVDKIVRKQPLINWAFEALALRGFLTTLASLEGRHTEVSAFHNWLLMWATLIGPDVGEAVLLRGWLFRVRDIVLSWMTLRNFEGPKDTPSDDDNRPLNRFEIDGIADIFVELAVLILAFSLPRDEYHHPFGDQFPNMVLKWQLGAGALAGFLGGLVGTIVAETVAWAEDWGVLGRKLLMSMVQAQLSFWPFLYLRMEGDTDGGRYNPNGPQFNGYPPADEPSATVTSSPYNLPYSPDRGVEYVGQTNQGLWSHNFINNSQIYAYDFSLDQDVPVLASRPGTVVFASDSTLDDSTATWNSIIIRHDVADARNPVVPDPTHDLGPNGVTVTTYAVYGHGRQGSITAAFGGTLPAVGTAVARGQQIMRAGDTGVSFHNHLHMHVVPDDGTGNPSGEPGSSVARVTIPFVFQEVTHLIGRDGVPKRLSWYRSKIS